MPFFLFPENVGWEQLTQDTQIEKTNAFAIEVNTGPMTVPCTFVTLHK